MKTPFRAPRIDRGWRMTLILASVIALLSAALAIEVSALFLKATGRVSNGGLQWALARPAVARQPQKDVGIALARAALGS
jgi:hypothetical protein